jgi:hypothetical protein
MSSNIYPSLSLSLQPCHVMQHTMSVWAHLSAPLYLPHQCIVMQLLANRACWPQWRLCTSAISVQCASLGAQATATHALPPQRASPGAQATTAYQKLQGRVDPDTVAVANSVNSVTQVWQHRQPAPHDRGQPPSSTRKGADTTITTEGCTNTNSSGDADGTIATLNNNCGDDDSSAMHRQHQLNSS